MQDIRAACTCVHQLFSAASLPPVSNPGGLRCDNIPVCISERSDAWHFDAWAQHISPCLQLACAALQFNARSETVAAKGIFKRLLASMRCMVLVNGFYEWKKASCA